MTKLIQFLEESHAAPLITDWFKTTGLKQRFKPLYRIYLKIVQMGSDWFWFNTAKFLSYYYLVLTPMCRTKNTT